MLSLCEVGIVSASFKRSNGLFSMPKSATMRHCHVCATCFFRFTARSGLTKKRLLAHKMSERLHDLYVRNEFERTAA